MKNKINTQRNSPSSPQEQAELRLEAGEGLDVTACSASFDLKRCYQWVVDRWKNGFSEEEEKMRNELREELRAAKEEIRLEKIGKHP